MQITPEKLTAVERAFAKKHDMANNPEKAFKVTDPTDVAVMTSSMASVARAAVKTIRSANPNDFALLIILSHLLALGIHFGIDLYETELKEQMDA